jgi:hypothetical protein
MNSDVLAVTLVDVCMEEAARFCKSWKSLTIVKTKVLRERRKRLVHTIHEDGVNIVGTTADGENLVYDDRSIELNRRE